MPRSFRSAFRLVIPVLVGGLVLAVGTGLGAQGGRGQGSARDGAGGTVIGTGSISGAIVLQGSGTPVRRARVTLTGTELGGGRSVISDDQGLFSFAALPAGRFTLTVAKAGFVNITYGAKRPGRPGTPIQVIDGQAIEDLVVAMPRGGVITGIVVDEYGDPSPGTPVRAMRYVIRTGERTLQQSGQDQTDDRGMYRIYQLQPGEYIVSAVPRNRGLADVRESIIDEVASLVEQAQSAGGGRAGNLGALGRLAGAPGAQQLLARAAALQEQLESTEQEQPTAYAPVFYPGTTSPASAATVNLGVGEERSGVDFRLQLLPTARVSGVVTSLDGSLPGNVSVALVPTDRGDMPSIPGLGQRMTRVGGDGRFSIQNVTPGQYSVQARANVMRPPDADAPATGRRGGRGRGQIAQVLWAAADVSVAGQDQADVMLMLQPGMTVSGRITFEGLGAQAPIDLSNVRVSLSTRGQQSFELGNAPPAVVDAAGQFTVAGVPPGRYTFSAAVPAGGNTAGPIGRGRGRGFTSDERWTLKSVMVNGRDALDFPMEVEPNQNVGQITVLFSDRRQTLSGMIQDNSGRPTSDFTIIVFPSEPQYWLPLSRRIASARPATDGRFSIRDLPAGNYRLTAVTDVEPGEWYDPAFLNQLVPASIAISLDEGQSRVQDIRLATGG